MQGSLLPIGVERNRPELAKAPFKVTRVQPRRAIALRQTRMVRGGGLLLCKMQQTTTRNDEVVCEEHLAASRLISQSSLKDKALARAEKDFNSCAPS
jgi:hypothetical protein